MPQRVRRGAPLCRPAGRGGPRPMRERGQTGLAQRRVSMTRRRRTSASRAAVGTDQILLHLPGDRLLGRDSPFRGSAPCRRSLTTRLASLGGIGLATSLRRRVGWTRVDLFIRTARILRGLRREAGWRLRRVNQRRLERHRRVLRARGAADRQGRVQVTGARGRLLGGRRGERAFRCATERMLTTAGRRRTCRGR